MKLPISAYQNEIKKQQPNTEGGDINSDCQDFIQEKTRPYVATVRAEPPSNGLLLIVRTQPPGCTTQLLSPRIEELTTVRPVHE